MNSSKEKPYCYDHAPIPFDFLQSVERFQVEELPLFQPSGRGQWLLLTIRKKEMSTYKLLSVLKSATGADDREIGYAGLKDKSATTIQRISLPRKYEKGLKNLTTERVEILERSLNHKPLSIGSLAGNAFRIVLNNVNSQDLGRLEKALKKMEEEGIPNYFGYQRFGSDGESWRQGREIARSGKKLRGAKERLLVAAWQSRLFNDWLMERVRISSIIDRLEARKASEKLSWPPELVEALRSQPQRFKIFLGDMMAPYPRGKSWRACRAMERCAADFFEKRAVPTGLLSGERVPRAELDARHLEAPYDDEEIASLRGSRRAAWIWPEKISTDYNADKRRLTLAFTLPPGAYATTLLEELAKRPLAPEKR